jgi:cytochrome P450
VEFCGKFIPGGTVVNMQMFTIQTHPNLWEDPLEFKPERWLKDPPTDALDEIMPFSRGVRLCLGINLAKLEVRLTIATLVYHFKFERVGNDDMSYNAVSVTFPRCHRLNVRVTERVH